MVGAMAAALDRPPIRRRDGRAGSLAAPLSAAVHLAALVLLWQWHSQPPDLADEPEFVVDLVPTLEEDAAPPSSLPAPAPPKPAFQAVATLPVRSGLTRPPAPFNSAPQSVQSEGAASDSAPSRAPLDGADGAIAASVTQPEIGPTIGVQVLDQPRPAYPPMARRFHQEGEVMVSIQVGSDGIAQSVAVERSSGYVALDEAAVAVTARWRFAPALESGKAVAASVRVPVRFRLSQP